MSGVRAWRRRFWSGLLTVAGARPRGYFIPHGFAAASDQPLRYEGVAARLRAQESEFRTRLSALDGYRDALRALSNTAPPAPRWQQDWFPRLDGAMAYAMVRTERPRRIVEVGGGHSTRFFARAAADEELPTRIDVIDPAPRASIADLPNVTVIENLVQAAGSAPFAALVPGDVLSIDSSHVLMPGSDVDFLLNDILPALPPGVWVHFHDIFLPDPYPGSWTWRGYNEQSAVALLVAQAGWTPVFASHYVLTRLSDAVQRSVVADLPLADGALESSLWLMTR